MIKERTSIPKSLKCKIPEILQKKKKKKKSEKEIMPDVTKTQIKEVPVPIIQNCQHLTAKWLLQHRDKIMALLMLKRLTHFA